MSQQEYLSPKAKSIFDKHLIRAAITADRTFAYLFIFQWLACIFLSLIVSPLAWQGTKYSIHIHVYAAVFLGGLLTIMPLYLVWREPGRTINRMVIATSQMLFSVLIIHLTGGRIESHFHIFGSLAFLSFYRDYRPILLATFITTVDHFLRGALWPESVYGVLSATPLRALEHAGWVVFEVVFLLVSVRSTLNAIRTIAQNQDILEDTLDGVEKTIRFRTEELRKSQVTIVSQQQAMVHAAKSSALGEMAGQAAHEINTPLGAIILTAGSLKSSIENDKIDKNIFLNQIELILKVTDKMTKIVSSMRKLAGHGDNESIEEVTIQNLVSDVTLLCEAQMKKNGIAFELNFNDSQDVLVQCRGSEVSQILINLLNNSRHAVLSVEERWIKLSINADDKFVYFKVTDSGAGISEKNRTKLFTANFTTKSLKEGTGFGLSISRKIAQNHGGNLYLDTNMKNTTFVLELPRMQQDLLLKIAAGS